MPPHLSLYHHILRPSRLRHQAPSIRSQHANTPVPTTQALIAKILPHPYRSSLFASLPFEGRPQYQTVLAELTTFAAFVSAVVVE